VIAIDSAPIRYHTTDSTAVITLNRPDVLNALNGAMRDELADSVRRAEHEDAVRVIVVRGAGDRAFCAGADIREFEPAASLVEVRESRLPPRWNEVVESSRKPTLAAIHGYCLGGGLELALACDIRIASSDSMFAFPEVQLGIIPGAGGTQRLSRVVGLGNALDLVLTGRRIDAHDALRMGLVSEVVELGGLDDAVGRWCSMLASGGSQAIAYGKEAVRAGEDLSLEAGLRLEADLASLLTNTEERLARADAFRRRASTDGSTMRKGRAGG
jgi:enoyl-CoA hydratase/carnithine racemase